MDIQTAINEITVHRSQFRQHEVPLDAGESQESDYEDELKNYRDKQKELRQVRDSVIRSTLETARTQFEKKLADGDFRFGLKASVLIKGRDIYAISDELSVVYPEKQAALVVKNLIFSHSPGRNGLIRALKECLSRSCDYYVYRIDIAKYYDSIPHDQLLVELKKHRKFDPITEKLVVQLLDEYSSLKKNDTLKSGKPSTSERCGVPAGIGLASQLAEFYLRDFDRLLKTQPGVWFYARYVDDIILVAENEESNKEALKKCISEILEVKGLKINQNKIKEITAQINGGFDSNAKLEYLGYVFERQQRAAINGEKQKWKLVTELTDKRLEKRLTKLRVAFETWRKTSPKSNKPNNGHDGMLIQRIRFIGGNFKLQNSKSNVTVGLYFSNSALDEDAQSLKVLDAELKKLISENGNYMSEVLKKKLDAISFVEMFKKKTFFKFTPMQLKTITYCWKAEEDEI